MTKDTGTPKKVTSPWVPATLFVLSAGFVLWSQKYGATARLMPTVMGGATAVLCLLDILSRFDTRVSQVLRVAMGADFRNREMPHDPALRDEAIQALWMIACVVMMLFIGILPTIPVFVAGYMRFFGDRSWTSSIVSGIAVLAFVVIVFEILLAYQLYRGVLFDPRGFDSW